MRINPAEFFRFCSRHTALLRELAEHTEGELSESQIFEFVRRTASEGDEQPETVVKQLKKLSIVEPVEQGEGYYIVAGPLVQLVRYLLHEAKPASSESVQGFVKSLDQRCNLLRHAIDADNVTHAELAISDINQTLRRIYDAVAETHQSILAAVAEFKTNRSGVSVRQKFQRIVYWMEVYVVPMVHIIRVDGEMEATFAEVERLLRLASDRTVFNDLGAVERNLRFIRLVRRHALRVAKLQSVDKLEGELSQWQKEEARLIKLKDAVVQRARHEQTLAELVDQKKKQAQRVHEYGQFKSAKENEADWRKQLGEVKGAIGALDTTISGFESAATQAQVNQTNLGNQRKEQVRQHNEVRLRFDKCLRPLFDEGSPRAGAEIPSAFDSAVSFYLNEQGRESTLAQELRTLLLQVQGFFGDRYNGATEGETIRRLREEMEGASEKEKFLQHDWDAHIQGLKTRFKQVLDDLGHIQAAATRLTSAFKQVQVSDLKAIMLTTDPNPDIVSIIKRLAGLEELDLWADQAPLETALQRVRELLDKNPIIRLSELFTLGVSVTGADNKVKHYHDLSQVESDGTTVTVKVLFNLLVLKSQLRKDDVALPFFLDELDRLDADNCRAVLRTAKALGFIAITAAPRPVGEVDACLFLERHPSGRVKLTSKHRLELRPKSVPAKPE